MTAAILLNSYTPNIGTLCNIRAINLSTPCQSPANFRSWWWRLKDSGI